MDKLLFFSIIVLCFTAIAITSIICFSNYQMSVGFTFRRNVRKEIDDLQYKIKDDILLYNGLRGTINKMKERIDALENRIKELSGEPNF